jgi:LuxR family transcriptional regulator, maltose regulon positive regulatory protein
MAAISLKNQADPAALLAHLGGKAHYLAGFLAEEVLDRQPGEIRQFLLRTSITHNQGSLQDHLGNTAPITL